MTAAEKKELLNYLMTSPAIRVREWGGGSGYTISHAYFFGTVDFWPDGNFFRDAKYDNKVKLGQKESEMLRQFCEEKVKEAQS